MALLRCPAAQGHLCRFEGDIHPPPRAVKLPDLLGTRIRLRQWAEGGVCWARGSPSAMTGVWWVRGIASGSDRRLLGNGGSPSAVVGVCWEWGIAFGSGRSWRGILPTMTTLYASQTW